MGLRTSVAAVKTHLETEMSDVSVYISANEPERFYDAVLKAAWPDSTNRLIVLYAEDSDVTLEQGVRLRRNHRLSINAYVQDDDTETRGTTLHTLFDDLDAALITLDGLRIASGSEPINTVQQPQAGFRTTVVLNYCGGT